MISALFLVETESLDCPYKQPNAVALYFYESMISNHEILH